MSPTNNRLIVLFFLILGTPFISFGQIELEYVSTFADPDDASYGRFNFFVKEWKYLIDGHYLFYHRGEDEYALVDLEIGELVKVIHFEDLPYNPIGNYGQYLVFYRDEQYMYYSPFSNQLTVKTPMELVGSVYWLRREGNYPFYKLVEYNLENQEEIIFEWDDIDILDFEVIIEDSAPNVIVLSPHNLCIRNGFNYISWFVDFWVDENIGSLVNFKESEYQYSAVRKLKYGYVIGGQIIHEALEGYITYVPIVINEALNYEQELDITMFEGPVLGDPVPFLVSREEDLVVFFDYDRSGEKNLPIGSPIFTTYRINYPERDLEIAK